MNGIQIIFPPPVLPSGGEKPVQESLPFRLGETLPGRVIQQVDPAHFLLSFQGQKFLVESRILLPEGVDLPLRVEALEPRIALRLLPFPDPEEGQISPLLKKNLMADLSLGALADKMMALEKTDPAGIPPPLRESLTQFFNLLLAFAPEALPDHPAVLAGLFNRSGFFWEQKIRNWMEAGGKGTAESLIQADLKGKGIEVLAQLNTLAARMDPAEAEKIKESLEPFLRKIELYQILNLQSPEGAERYGLFLPFWIGDRLQFVEFNLGFPGEKSPSRRKKDRTSILFLLQLPALGKVRIEVQLKEKDLFCRFSVSDPGVSEFLGRAAPGLEERLQRMGYRTHLQVSLRPAEDLEENPWAQTGLDSPDLFNIII